MKHSEFLKRLPQLVKNYEPTPGVLQQLKNLELLMIIGPSGVGKSSIINRLDIKYVPSDTTRKPRSYEIEGQDFFFRDDIEQIANEIKAGQFVQIAVGSEGDLFGTIANAYPLEGWIVMAVITDALDVFRQLGFKKTLSAFIVPPSYKEWMRRIENQGFSDEARAKRLDEAKGSLGYALADKQMHFILNDDLSNAVNQVNKLLVGRVDPEREATARSVAVNLKEQLDAKR